ncbi:MAG TPA: ABC transporter ATP-binding protein [Puia sp.]|nr:ABC transporter ATP-binding protein [Puia sp.]
MKKIIKNIFSILSGKEKKRFITLVITDIFFSVLDITFLAILLYLVHFYTSQQQVTIKNAFLFTLINKYPFLPIIIFLVFFSIKNMFGFIVFRDQFRFVYQVASRLSRDNAARYLSGNFNDYVSLDSSVHIRKIGQHPIEFGFYILGGLQQIISQSILISITVIAILIYNPVLFPLLLLVLTPPVILSGILFKKKIQSIRKIAKNINEKVLQNLHEAISGFVESNIYDRKDFFISRYYKQQATSNYFQAEQQSMQNMPGRMMEIFAILGFAILIVINSFTAKTNIIQITTLGAFLAAAYKIIPGIVKILNSAGQMKTFSFVTDALLKNISHEKIKNSIHSTDPISSIALKNIFFNYYDRSILNNFSLNIEKGEIAGIGGSSGKGKTTIINLLLGFLDPSAGEIYINNAKANLQERQKFWNKIAYAKQQSFFIHDTLLKNILLDDEKYDAQKLNEIISITGADKIINAHAEGLQYIIEENGKNISGGERQRIVFARTLYKEADLIILDEPFTELDETSELNMIRHLQQLAKKGKMIILITHNKKSFDHCNKIISLD